MSRDAGYIKGFNGLRAIAVLTVIAFHGEVWSRLGLPASAYGWSTMLGVPMFFVLSGFLITSLLLAEEARGHGVNVWSFYARRALRILPLYFLALGVFVAAEVGGLIRLPACTYWHAFTHTLNFAPTACQYSPMSHFWSLAVEEHFYLLWPLLFLAGRRVAFGALVVFLVACHVVLLNAKAILMPFEPVYTPFRWTFPAALPIAIGALAAFYVRSPLSKAVFTTRYSWLLVPAAVLVVYLQPRATFSYLAIASVLLFIFYNQGAAVTRALEWRPIAYLGTISYGLYVWQGILGGNGPYRDFPQFPPPMDVGLLLTFVVASVSFHLFERPILRLKKRFGSVPLAVRVAASGAASR